MQSRTIFIVINNINTYFAQLRHHQENTDLYTSTYLSQPTNSIKFNLCTAYLNKKLGFFLCIIQANKSLKIGPKYGCELQRQAASDCKHFSRVQHISKIRRLFYFSYIFALVPIHYKAKAVNNRRHSICGERVSTRGRLPKSHHEQRGTQKVVGAFWVQHRLSHRSLMLSNQWCIH